MTLNHQYSNNMKTIILLVFVTISLAYADPSTTSPGSTETSSKPDTKTANSITSAPAPKASYYSSTRAPSYVQLIQKPLFTSHHHAIPQTMLIIAQPALVPQHLIYNQASSVQAQQLLNYFHSNPSAKYQLLYGYQPPQQHQQQQQQHQQVHQQSQSQPIYYAAPAPTTNNYQHYQYVAQPQPQSQHYSSYPTHYTQSAPTYNTPQYTQIPASTYTHQAIQAQQQQQHQPQHHQLVQSQPITHAITQPISQPATQAQYNSHFYSQGPQTFTPQTPIKTAAPIITGLENFSPEQQAQIKEQLSNHFGSITQINSNSLQANPSVEYSSKFRIEVQPDAEYTTTSAHAEGNNASAKQEAREEQPSQAHQLHQLQLQQQQQQPHYVSQQAASSSFSPPAYTYRTPQYTKG